MGKPTDLGPLPLCPASARFPWVLQCLVAVGCAGVSVAGRKSCPNIGLLTDTTVGSTSNPFRYCTCVPQWGRKRTILVRDSPRLTREFPESGANRHRIDRFSDSRLQRNGRPQDAHRATRLLYSSMRYNWEKVK